MIALPVLSDPQQRKIGYVRISLTDRCNYRCVYCMPEEGVSLAPKSDVLTFEEIERLVRVLARVGVRRVRLTGGEPTVRRDLVVLVERLSALGLDDLAMTTNGQRLRELAAPLKRAGLRRLNVSLDTLDEGRFRAVTRRGDLAAVLDGIEAAREAGFSRTKINVVGMRGFNDGELGAICRYAFARDLIPRFIEFMPMSDGALFTTGGFLAAAEMRAAIAADLGPLGDVVAPGEVAGVGPARYQRVQRGEFAGRLFGIISAVTEPFCETCNRVRLSAVGRLHTCLALDDDTDLRGPLRSGASDDELLAHVRSAVAGKKDGHTFNACGGGGPHKNMVSIGG